MIMHSRAINNVGYYYEKVLICVMASQMVNVLMNDTYSQINRH